MASIQKNIEGKTFFVSPKTKISIVQSAYNPKITDALRESCIEELKKADVLSENIHTSMVPGAFELPLGCQRAIQKDEPDAVIALGLVLQGETPHFDYVAGPASQGLMDVSLKYNLPVIMGILTTLNQEQADARVRGGSHGDKGIEAAQAALSMLQD